LFRPSLSLVLERTVGSKSATRKLLKERREELLSLGVAQILVSRDGDIRLALVLERAANEERRAALVRLAREIFPEATLEQQGSRSMSAMAAPAELPDASRKRPRASEPELDPLGREALSFSADGRGEWDAVGTGPFRSSSGGGGGAAGGGALNYGRALQRLYSGSSAADSQLVASFSLAKA
jgi:hypothetical protein